MAIRKKRWETPEILLFLVALSSLFFLIGIIMTLFWEGIPAFQHIRLSEFLFGRRWLPTADPPLFGLLPLFTGSLLVTVGSLLFAVPLGIFSALFLAEICPVRMREILKPVVEMLAGIPSVVYGFFAVVILGPSIRDLFSLPTGLTAFTASFLLGIMAVPSIVSVAEDAITSVPRDYREASTALGATHWETIRHAVFPAAFSGIGASIVLGTGRIIGETMTVLMVAGGAAVIPTSLFQPVRTMTASLAAEMAEAPFRGLHYRTLFSVAIVLFLVTLLLNIVVEYMVHKYHSRVR